MTDNLSRGYLYRMGAVGAKVVDRNDAMNYEAADNAAKEVRSEK